ncbi:MAG: MBL fold metallo-hydrolase [Propionibacteriaceae bacterium]|nr:MBL fold metallo-hydrolase [Propionibacteriaceae bacterium]
MFIASVTVSPWAANCYLAGADGGGECVIIDPGITGAELIVGAVERSGRTPVAILGTHGHLDHVGDAAVLADRYRVPVYLHPADQHLLTHPADGLGPAAVPLLMQLLGTATLPAPHTVRDFADGEEVSLAGIAFLPLLAPGHTAGSTLLTCPAEDAVFTGDVVFAGSVGRVDLPGGSARDMKRTIETVLPGLPRHARLYPGHGGATTMAHEWSTNPYLQPDIWK